MINFKKIRQLRRMQDISQRELAARVGYSSQNSLHKLEKGKTDLPTSRLEKIASVLGVSVSELLISNYPEANNQNNI